MEAACGVCAAGSQMSWQICTAIPAFHLEVTQKYIDYYNISSNYMSEVMDRIMARFSPEDCGKLEEILTVVSRELMPEVPLPDRTEE